MRWRKHQSANESLENNVTKTSHKLLFGKGVQCNREISLIVSDITITVEGLGNLIKNLRRRSTEEAGKKFSKILMKNPARASETGARIDTAAVSQNPKAISTIPGFINFYRTGKRMNLELLVEILRSTKSYYKIWSICTIKMIYQSWREITNRKNVISIL